MTERQTRIGDIARVVAGGTPPRGVATYYGGSIPWVKTLDLNCGAVTNSEEHITAEGLSAIRGELNPPGTVMVAMYGGAGTIGKSGVLGIEAATNQAVASVLPNPKVFDSHFLHFQLMHIRGEWMRFSQGNRKDPNINKSVVEDMMVWVPVEVPEQVAIAATLSGQLAEVDAARQAAEAQLRDITLLRSRTLKTIFAELGAAPRKILGDHATTMSGVTPSRGDNAYWQPAEIPWVKTGEVAFAPITATEESISAKALAECSLALLPPKTVLIAITGEGKTRGRSAVLEVPATTNQHSVAVLPNVTWESDFLQLWLQSSYLDLRQLSEGRGGSRSALSGAQIKALQVPTPDRTVQQDIVQRAQAAMATIDTMEQACKASLKDIEQLPQRILAQAFEQVAA